jgi:hypothetical protein
MGLLDDIMNSYGGGGLLGAIPQAQPFQAPGAPMLTDTERQLQAMVTPDRMLTPTESRLQAMVFPAPLPNVPAAPIFAQPQSPPQGAVASPAATAPRTAAVSADDSEDDPQASPINIGGYQMPRVGLASAYEPAATDVSARARAPAGATMPDPFAAPAASTGGFGGLSRGAIANMHNGPLGMIAGALAGAMGMGQGSPEDAARREKKAQYDALLANGFTPQQAMLSILNPKAAETMIAQKLGGPKAPTVLGNGYVWNPQSGKVERAYEPEGKYSFATMPDGTVVRQDPASGAVAPAYQGGGKASSLTADVAARRQTATEIGLKPDDPAYKTYLATGKMPREDQQPLTATDKQAIMDAEDQVFAAQNAVTNLNKAKELSKAAFEGPTAGLRGTVGALVGNEGAIATKEMDNLITTNALQSLKSIFGGNPTEGERAILLKIQGASSETHAVREKIFDEAIRMANRRMEFNRRKADELRGGSYYKPQKPGETQQQPAAPAGGAYTWTPDGGLSPK